MNHAPLYRIELDDNIHERAIRSFWNNKVAKSNVFMSQSRTTRDWMKSHLNVMPFAMGVNRKQGKILVETIDGKQKGWITIEAFKGIENYHRKFKANDQILRLIQVQLLSQEPRLSAADLLAAWARPEIVIKQKVRRDRMEKMIEGDKVVAIRPRSVWSINGRRYARLQDVH